MNKTVKKAAIAGGIVWGVMIFLSTFASMYWGYGTEWLRVMMSIYPGYTITPVGSVVGLIYGFFDIFIGTYIVYWVYKQIK